MKRLAGVATVLIVIGAVAMSGMAQDEDLPKITVEANLELFYELSDDISGEGDNDKFKSNQLYLDFQGEFDNNMAARLLLDGADIVSADGKVVTEKVVEEANFTMKEICGSPITLVFGKDEMPFGLDYDEYLNDSLAHQFELDKVWGFHGMCDIPDVGNIAAATYQHRHSLGEGETRLSADNEVGDNYSAKLTIDQMTDVLVLNISGGSETYSDLSVMDDTGAVATEVRDDETRVGAGLIVKCPVRPANVNVEYIAFSNKGGDPGYDPGLLTLGVEGRISDKWTTWVRYEMIDEDTDEAVETDLWTVGVVYEAAKGYKLLVEYSNFNSANMTDATDLVVADGSLENALLLGVKARF